MFWYVLIKEKRQTEWRGKVIVYGVAVYRVDRRGIRRCLEVADVSADRKFMRRLVRDCTRGQLAPMQLYDVLEDRLG